MDIGFLSTHIFCHLPDFLWVCPGIYEVGDWRRPDSGAGINVSTPYSCDPDLSTGRNPIAHEVPHGNCLIFSITLYEPSNTPD
jgi:hypothetical protein